MADAIDHGDWFGALEAGAAYAFAGHLLDQHAEKVASQASPTVHVHLPTEDDDAAAPMVVQPNDRDNPEWDAFVGQEPLKHQLRVHINSAQQRGAALDHVLLASGYPGVGKTSMARLIAREMGVALTMLVPPFSDKTLHEAVLAMDDFEILLIDEAHKMADGGRRKAESLLHILEERRLYLPDGVVELADITVIAATTEPDKLPEPVLDRFGIKPYFQPYTYIELCRIAAQFEGDLGFELDMDTAIGLADACRGTPRVLRELVAASRDLELALGRPCTLKELLAFKELEPDGMTRMHIAYLTNLRKFFKRERADGRIEYVAGEATMAQLLRQTKQGIGTIERYLIELGLLDRTPYGRRLTKRGVRRAERYIRRGKASP